MSFLDIENQKQPPFGNDSNSPNNLIGEFVTQVKKLEKECRKLGTKHDSDEVRTTIIEQLLPLCSSIRDQIRSLHLEPDNKLYTDFDMVNKTFLSLENDYNIKKKEAVPKKSDLEGSSSYISIMINEETPLLFKDNLAEQQNNEAQIQQQQTIKNDQNTVAINQEDLDFQTIVQQERGAQISRIHGAVSDVNAIFHQLDSLIKEQGEEVDNIDENINQFSGNLQRANEQLKKADENQRKRNRCGMTTLIIIVVVCLIMVLAILS